MTPSHRKRHPDAQGTPRQQANNYNREVILKVWYNMTPPEKFAFAWLGPFIPDWDGKRAARPLTAYQVFQSICRARLAAGLELTRVAPDAVDLPPALGRLTLTATCGPIIGPMSVPARTLRLTPPAPYPFPCQIWAARPQMEWTTNVPLNRYAAILSVPSLPADGVDLCAAFLQTYPDFQAGHKLMLRVCPISPSGFRGQTVPTDAVVEAQASLSLVALPLLENPPAPLKGSIGRQPRPIPILSLPFRGDPAPSGHASA